MSAILYLKFELLVEMGPAGMKTSVINRSYRQASGRNFSSGELETQIQDWHIVDITYISHRGEEALLYAQTCPQGIGNLIRHHAHRERKQLLSRLKKNVVVELLSKSKIYSHCLFQICVTMILGSTYLVPWLRTFIYVVDGRIQKWTWFSVIWYVRKHP